MKIDEFVVLAEQGNVDAMMHVGIYYMTEATGEGVKDTAVYWLSKAAKEGKRIDAIELICAHKSILASLQELIKIDDEECINLRKEIFDWRMFGYDILRNSTNDKDIDFEEYLQGMEEARYRLALSYTFSNNIDEAWKLVKDFDDIKSQVMAAFIMATSDLDKSIVEEFISKIKVIDGNVEYAMAEKDKYEEGIYAIVVTNLALLYRVIYNDINGSMEVLKFARAYIKDKYAQSIIDKELACYRKKLFGGYVYKE